MNKLTQIVKSSRNLVIPVGWQMIKGRAKDGDKFWSPFFGEWSYVRARHVGEHISRWSCPVIRKIKSAQRILPSKLKKTVDTSIRGKR